MSLTHKTTIGVLWNFAEQLGRRGISVVITLLLARFLAPEDFGLIAMMAVFLTVGSSLMDSGFAQALIRMQNAKQVDFNTAFYANLVLGALAYALLFMAAPYIATFYDEPRLINLVRVASVGVVISSFNVVQSAILSRALNFKVQLEAALPAGLISGGVAVGLAYSDYGVWALVVQMLLGSLVTAIILWHRQGWRPSMSFCSHSLRQMYGFGYRLFLSGLLDTVFTNLYLIVIAKLFSASIAGYYFFAVKIKEVLISQLVSSIQKVTYPALASVQDDDARLKSGYRKVIAVTTFMLFPAMTLTAALAEPIFEVLLPERWASAAVYLQLMCLAALLTPLHSINLNILKVKGRSDLFLYLEIVKKLVAVGILFVAYRHGVIGILMGQIVSSVLAYLPNSYFSRKLIGYPPREQMADFMPGLLLALAIGGATYAVVQIELLSALGELLILAGVSVSLYILGAHILRLEAYGLARELLIKRGMAKGGR